LFKILSWTEDQGWKN